MKKLLLASMTLACTMSVFGQTAPGTLTYADFIKSCQNPAGQGQQRPPENIRVACKNIQRTWQPLEAGSTTIAESRNISTELFSDKYHVLSENFVVAVPELNVSCPRLREVMQTSQIEKAMTCAQVISETRSLKEVCLDAINEAISANPDLVVTVPTGNTYSSCSGPVQK
jgi:hypothetical protein